MVSYGKTLGPITVRQFVDYHTNRIDGRRIPEFLIEDKCLDMTLHPHGAGGSEDEVCRQVAYTIMGSHFERDPIRKGFRTEILLRCVEENPENMWVYEEKHEPLYH